MTRKPTSLEEADKLIGYGESGNSISIFDSPAPTSEKKS